MGAADKLIPIATQLANNLKGTKYSTSGTYKLPARKASIYENPWIDSMKFFASVYAKELKIAESNAIWNHELVDGNPLVAPYSPNQHIHNLNLGALVAVSEEEWNELQITISRCFNIINGISEVPPAIPLQDLLSYADLIGVIVSSPSPTAALTDANGNPLPGSPFNQGVDYAEAWNTLKVPADAALGVLTYYIAPVLNQDPGTDVYQYRYTGVRRWFDFTGYDLF